MYILYGESDDRFCLEHDDLYFMTLSETCNLSNFSCGNRYLDEFLLENALTSQIYNVSATKLACLQGSFVGYFTLVNDCVVTDMIETDDRKEDYAYRKYPALKIGRFATHQNYRKMGIGLAMLTEIYIIAFGISAQSGCRFITVDSKHESADFYLKNGFKPAVGKANYDTIPMYLDFYKLSKILGFM